MIISAAWSMGRNGQITVNGKTYNGTMVPMNYLTDEQIANVLTYVRNSFGNAGDAVSIDDVKKVRSQIAPPPAEVHSNLKLRTMLKTSNSSFSPLSQPGRSSLLPPTTGGEHGSNSGRCLLPVLPR